MKTPADNEHIGKMAAVPPQTILYKFARYYPAGSLVNRNLLKYCDKEHYFDKKRV